MFLQERRRNVDRKAATRSALLVAARALFVEKGYAETATPDVVTAAGVTRGALYHHFADKLALFEAVIEAEAAAVAAEIEAATTAIDGSAALRLGTAAFFDAMTAPGRCRLLLREAPAALPPERLSRIDAATGGRTLQDGLGDDVSPALVELLSAAYDRAALAIAGGGNREIYEAATLALVDAVRART
jgi:AcrR family transcriptional regulator